MSFYINQRIKRKLSENLVEAVFRANEEYGGPLLLPTLPRIATEPTFGESEDERSARDLENAKRFRSDPGDTSPDIPLTSGLRTLPA